MSGLLVLQDPVAVCLMLWRPLAPHCIPVTSERRWATTGKRDERASSCTAYVVSANRHLNRPRAASRRHPTTQRKHNRRHFKKPVACTFRVGHLKNWNRAAHRARDQYTAEICIKHSRPLLCVLPLSDILLLVRPTPALRTPVVPPSHDQTRTARTFAVRCGATRGICSSAVARVVGTSTGTTGDEIVSVCRLRYRCGSILWRHSSVTERRDLVSQSIRTAVRCLRACVRLQYVVRNTSGLIKFVSPLPVSG